MDLCIRGQRTSSGCQRLKASSVELARSGCGLENNAARAHSGPMQGGFVHKARFIGNDRQARVSRNCRMGASEDENYMVFDCLLYAPLSLKHSNTFAAAQDLSSVCKSPLAARFMYDCYLMQAEFVAEN